MATEVTEVLEAVGDKPVPTTGEGWDPLVALRQRRADRMRQYWTTIGKLASGERVAPGQLEKLVGDRTPQQIERDLELMRERDALRQVIAEVEPAAQRAEAARAELRAAVERFEVARRERDEALRRANAAAGAARAAAEQSIVAESRLIASCPDESLRLRLDALVNERAELVGRLGAIADPDERAALEARAGELAEMIERVRQEMIEF